MLTKKDMSHLVKMSCIGACVGFAVVLAFAITLV